jgi:Homocysteine S-methyltransferase
MRRDGCFDRTSLPPVPDKMRLERGNALLNTKEKPLELREKLEGRLLVGDGAMGTLLADAESNKANLTHAHLVRDLHEQYLRAGARVRRR